MNSCRLTLRCVGGALVVASVGCNNDSPATAPAAVASRGSSNKPATAPTASVGGTWTATLPPSPNGADSTRWSLFLAQKGEKLEGSLTQIAYIKGESFVGVSAIKAGSIAGREISLELDQGEGAERPTVFAGSVSDDGESIIGAHSRLQALVTFTRR
jgi:hypothetical protein